MSAFLVAVEHIDTIITAWIALGDARTGWRPSLGPSAVERKIGADEVGRLLWQTNLDAVNALYPRDKDDGIAAMVADYRHTPVPMDPYLFKRIIGRVFRVIDCYEYQACDAPTWEISKAREFLDTLRSQLCARLPEYNEAPWGVNDRTVFSWTGGAR